MVGKMGSEADAGRVPARLWVGRIEARIEGRRNRVGGAVGLTSVAVDDPEEPDEDVEDSDGSSLSFFCSFSFVFLELGLGGGLLASSSSWHSLLGIPS